MNSERNILITVALLFLGTIVFGQSRNVEINRFLNDLDSKDFLGAILVAHNDEVIEKRAYGLASVEYGVENNTDIGYGIDVDLRYNQTILGHSGGWYGIHCELMDFVKDGYTVVILSNFDDGGNSGASVVADFFKGLIGGG